MSARACALGLPVGQGQHHLHGMSDSEVRVVFGKACNVKTRSAHMIAPSCEEKDEIRMLNVTWPTCAAATVKKPSYLNKCAFARCVSAYRVNL